jgi:hypothetical protein
LAPQSTRACGPHFENNAFPTTDRELFSLPLADFDQELVHCGFKPLRRQSAEGDDDLTNELADLRADLEQSHISQPERDQLIERYTRFRSQFRRFTYGRWSYDPVSVKTRLKAPIPGDLPEEFNLYLRGSAAYHRRQFEGARYWWNRLLDLPPEHRKYRSVWAAYMIGRTYAFSTEPGDAQLAIEWMARARFFAAHGFADSQNLARASLGWQARGHLDRRQYERAFELYFALGDSESLAITARYALCDPEDVMDRLARHELSSKVITSIIVAQGSVWATRWLAALERCDLKELDGADRIAWAAYQQGDVPAARRWLAHARPDTPMSRWLTSKFLLRQGKLDEAAAILAALVRDWPVNSEWQPLPQLAGELGVLRMHRGRYVEAMDLLLRRALFLDAAYVAERVLTIDELRAYVDANWPEGAAAPPALPASPRDPDRWTRVPPDKIPSRIRYLLARRLMRLGRPRDATLYYPADVRPLLDQYLAALAAAHHDPTLSHDERGEALWSAAQLARYQGMQLMATELEPDFFIYDGDYGAWNDRLPDRLHNDGPITAPSHDEYLRALSSAPAPDRRFHYRYIAADHAWAAAQLLPDESDLKAQVLHQAGRWLMAQDAPAAQRFYQSLVRDCGTTKLGREARRRKWFP